MPLERLEHEITELASHIHAATCRWLGLVAEFDRRGGWGQWGCKSCAHFISWRCSIAPRAARDHVRVAHRLEELPLIRAAFAEGRLSYSKVRALVRVENVEREEELLSLARHATAAQLENLVRAYRGVVARDRAAAGGRPERFVTWSHDDDGSLLLRARLPAEEGELVLAALEAAAERASVRSDGGSAEPHAVLKGPGRASSVPFEDVGGSAEPPTSPASRLRDSSSPGEGEGGSAVPDSWLASTLGGSGSLFEDAGGSAVPDSSLASPLGGSSASFEDVGGSAEPPSSPDSTPRDSSTPRAGDGGSVEPPRSVGERRADALVLMADTLLANGPSARGGDRYQVVVHVDSETLAADGDGARCELADGAPLVPETARRLACDAAIVTLFERNGRPLSVGRKTRSVPPALRRALASRDRGCRFPGCPNRCSVDAHHIEHWADGGSTSIDNLVQLCRHHHRLLHEGGYSVERRGSRFVFRRPDGREIRAVPRAPRGRTAMLREANRRRGGPLQPDACVPASYEPMDLGLCVDAMLSLAPLEGPGI